MTGHDQGAHHDPSEQHPGSDRLADFAGDVLPPGEAAQVERHTAECQTCRVTVDGLAGVTAMLRSAPAEVPTPADVSARIGAAIENAADTRATELELARESAGSGPVAWFRRRFPRVLVATASVGVLALAGYVAVSGIDNGGTDNSTVADAPDAGQLAQEEDAGGDGAGQARDDAVPEEAPADEQAGQDVDAMAAAPSPSEIQAGVREVYASNASLRDDCGQQIASEQDQALIGSADMASGVLVVLEDAGAGVLHGWLIPTCTSLSAEAITDVETIDRPSE